MPITLLGTSNRLPDVAEITLAGKLDPDADTNDSGRLSGSRKDSGGLDV